MKPPGPPAPPRLTAPPRKPALAANSSPTFVVTQAVLNKEPAHGCSRMHPLSRFAPSPSLAAREGDAPSGLAKPVPRVHWYGPRPCHTPRAASNIKEYFHESH